MDEGGLKTMYSWDLESRIEAVKDASGFVRSLLVVRRADDS